MLVLNSLTVFQNTLVRFIDHSKQEKIFNQPNKALTSFAIDDAIATSVGDYEVEATARIWVHDKTIVLGIPDTRLPYLEQGLHYLQEHHYKAVVRNSGGLAVALDKGVVNLSFIIPNTSKVSINDGYDIMYAFVQQLFQPFTTDIKAYEIVGSYCPGNYDLSINGVKFAGISQRRVRNGIAIQIYLDVEGDSKERARIVRQFYSLSKQDETTNFTYPDVNPNVMGTINELIHTSFTVDDVIQMIKQTLMELGAEVKIGNVMLSEENVFHKRFEQMQKRNEKIHIIKNRLQE